jgi:catechol 2,3-dioxygenase-like lactoylglutathione lyase family enzyme
MLANVPVCATLPTTDLERAKRFYGDALGLTESVLSADGGVFFKAGGGTMVRIYERPPVYTVRSSQHSLDAPERTRTSTDHSVHKALNLARLPIPPQAQRARV